MNQGNDRTDRLLAWLRSREPQMRGFEQAKTSAVCIPFLKDENKEWRILFEVRSAKLPEQPGDICLPGGMLESGETPAQAAMRELKEELLLADGQAELLGTGDVLYQPAIIIHTFPVLLRERPASFNEEEVAELFTVPLSFFLETEPEMYYVTRSAVPEENFPFERIWGGRNYRWRSSRSATYFYQWKDRTIWGLTAKILRDFVGELRQAEKE